MKKTFTLFIASLCAVLTSFSQNGGLHFDGINDYVTIPEKAGMLTSNPFTVEFWLKPTGSLAQTPFVLRKTNDNYTSGLEIYLAPNGNGLLEADLFKNGAGSGVFYSFPSSWTNQWHHVAVSFDGTTLRLFIDGLQVGTTAASGLSQTTNGAPIYLGAYDATGSMNFPGVLDELRFWNTAVSQSQIQANMNKEISATTANLVAYYRFNQGILGGTNTAITTLVDQVAAQSGTMFNYAKAGATSNFVTGYGAISVLAIKEGSFTASKKGTAVQLDWNGLSEDGASSLFTIERSNNGIDFRRIGESISGIRQGESFYSFTDLSPLSAINYYRVKSTDVNGRISYSHTIAVVMNKGMGSLQLYPNPAVSSVQLQVTAPKGVIAIDIKDMTGKTVRSMQVGSPGGTFYTPFDVSPLAKGMYIVTTGKESCVMIKQ